MDEVIVKSRLDEEDLGVRGLYMKICRGSPKKTNPEEQDHKKRAAVHCNA